MLFGSAGYPRVGGSTRRRHRDHQPIRIVMRQMPPRHMEGTHPTVDIETNARNEN